VTRRRQVAEYLRYLQELGVPGLEPRRPAVAGRGVQDRPRLPAAGAVSVPPEPPRPRGERAAAGGSAPGPGSARGPDDLFSDRPTMPAGLEAPAALEWVRTEWVGDCRRCKLHAGRTKLVFGVGDPAARLMFVGEGPGRDEDLQGEPFVGRAGQLLNRIIEAIGLSRADVYIANVVKCRPPENRNPEPDEVAACRGFLDAQIEIVRPEALVLLGKFAAQTLLDDKRAISRLRGAWHEVRGIAAMVTWHPAYLLRNPAAKRDTWEDMKQVRDRLGLPS